jgi:nucleotide-binding universal stress UspA family protein
MDLGNPVIDHILHPSDLSEASHVAFAHALKAALISGARLTMLHVSAKPGGLRWEDFPGVQDTLERWGARPRETSQTGASAAGVAVTKIVARHNDPVEAVEGYLQSHPADLIVLATAHYRGRMRWLRKSVAVPLARRSHQMTLFIPAGLDGFVSLASGSVSLRNVLLPIAATPRPQPALAAAVRLVRRLECESGEFTLVHVGEAGSMPAVRQPTVPGWTWTTATGKGDVIDGIIDMARETRADLVVMTTDGRNGFLDALRGSHSERVLSRASCPVLAIPAESAAADRLG